MLHFKRPTTKHFSVWVHPIKCRFPFPFYLSSFSFSFLFTFFLIFFFLSESRALIIQCYKYRKKIFTCIMLKGIFTSALFYQFFQMDLIKIQKCRAKSNLSPFPTRESSDQPTHRRSLNTVITFCCNILQCS